LLELPIIPLNNYPKEISDMATAALETQPGQGLNGPDQQLMQKQSGIWNTLMDRYFRLDFEDLILKASKNCRMSPAC
jgi:hypothetical protein